MSEPMTEAMRDGIRAGLATAEHHVGGISDEQTERVPVFSALLRLASIVLLHADDVLDAELSNGASSARAEAEQLLHGALETMEGSIGLALDAPAPVERVPDALAAAVESVAPGFGLTLPTSAWDESLAADMERLDGASARRLARALGQSGRLVGATAEDLVDLSEQPAFSHPVDSALVRRLACRTRLCELIGVEPVRLGCVPFALVLDSCLTAARGVDTCVPDDVWLLPRTEWHEALSRRAQVLLTPVEAGDEVDDVRIACAAFGVQQAALVLVDGRTFVVESSTHALRISWSEHTTSVVAAPRRFAAGLAAALEGRRLIHGVAGEAAGCRPNSYELTLADQAVIFEAPDLRVRIVGAPRIPPVDMTRVPF